MEFSDPQSIQAALEAFLFLYGEPVERARARKALGVSDDALGDALASLKETFAGQSRGLQLLEDGDRIQLVTKPAFGELLTAFMREELREELSPASLEALAVIAYAGPVARSEVDYLRGVNSSFIIRSLLIRGLVDRAPDPERGNAYAYRASMDFLKHLGLLSREALPDYAEVRRTLQAFRASPAAPAATPIASPSPPHA